MPQTVLVLVAFAFVPLLVVVSVIFIKAATDAGFFRGANEKVDFAGAVVAEAAATGTSRTTAFVAGFSRTFQIFLPYFVFVVYMIWYPCFT
jgi:hypothetical protein